ncbi:MAG: ABC transporter permease [Verrucomicrobia bacterium]|nr:ABC transporter permease [Verrucomicrobiota bacterium]MBV9658096.1 ABC transporter permease [Verrucomicrobiota bacterium]
MTFFIVVLRGLLRRPVRTGLTLVGISIGIGAVVALVGMSRGFESSWTAGMKSRGTDIVVNSMGSSLTPKPFPASVRDRITQLPGIAATSTLLVELMGIENSEMMIVSAREWGGFAWDNLKVISGRLPHDAAERAVVLGTTAAEMLHKKVGDPLQIETEELSVVGIVDGGAVVENGAVILSLSLLQEIMGTAGKINIIDVRVKPGTDETAMRRLCDEITQRIPEARAEAAGEHIRSSQGYRIINAMSWGTSLLAVLVGVLGVMNTMLMTVFERKQEISILLAIGWRRSRIVRLILWESALLGFFGGVVGVILGVVGMQVLERTPAIRGLLQPDLSPSLMALAVAIAVVVGILSGLYPAWRSSRLHPGAALQG